MKNFVKIQPQLYNFINIVLDISSITDRILLLEILTINSIFGSIISVKKKYFGDKILVNILGQAQIHYFFQPGDAYILRKTPKFHIFGSQSSWKDVIDIYKSWIHYLNNFLKKDLTNVAKDDMTFNKRFT